MKNNKTDSTTGMVTGMCIGLAVGTAVGAATHNMGLWMPVGMCLGMSVGLALSAGSAGKPEKTVAGPHVKAPEQIRENIWQFTEGDKPYFDVNAYLIVGDRSALLVDALQSETGLLEEIRKLTDKPLEV